jgi:hypothetical protein
VAPKTKVFLGGSRFANVGVGLTVAIVAGVVLVASGVLMLVSRNRQAPASDGQGAAPELVG